MTPPRHQSYSESDSANTNGEDANLLSPLSPMQFLPVRRPRQRFDSESSEGDTASRRDYDNVSNSAVWSVGL